MYIFNMSNEYFVTAQLFYNVIQNSLSVYVDQLSNYFIFIWNINFYGPCGTLIH